VGGEGDRRRDDDGSRTRWTTLARPPASQPAFSEYDEGGKTFTARSLGRGRAEPGDDDQAGPVGAGRRTNERPSLSGSGASFFASLLREPYFPSSSSRRRFRAKKKKDAHRRLSCVPTRRSWVTHLIRLWRVESYYILFLYHHFVFSLSMVSSPLLLWRVRARAEGSRRLAEAFLNLDDIEGGREEGNFRWDEPK